MYRKKTVVNESFLHLILTEPYICVAAVAQIGNKVVLEIISLELTFIVETTTTTCCVIYRIVTALRKWPK